MAFGQNPVTSTQTSLPANQFPIATVAVPNTANGDLTALEGGPISTDSNSNKTAPASMYVKDGSNVSQGSKADSAATDSTSSWSIIALLKGLYAKLAGTLTVGGSVSVSNLPATQPVSGTFWQTTQPVSGTVTANVAQVNGATVAVGNNALPILSSAATGYVSAYGSNAAALTSSTDYAFKWGAGGTTQINHIMIQNNTASSLNFDLDVAATAGSPVLAAGQTLFLDVQTTALHLWQAGTPNVNGSSASNIVVRGWL